MPWLQIHVAVPESAVEKTEDALLALGACAVTFTDAADQPLFEPLPGETPLWHETVVTGLFEDGADVAVLTAALKRQLTVADSQLQTRLLEDRPWERAWMDDFRPMRFGRRLWICPSWCPPPQPEAVNLMLDPGLAFGTGTHETTALCLEWLDGMDLTGRTVLDYGCGSGVLGIAALLLGAAAVLATDIDDQALTATRENALNNHQSDQLRTCFPDEVPADFSADVVIANILAGPLVELAPELARLCRAGGQVVLSGILAEQTDDIIRAYSPWFELEAPARKGDWIRIAGQRR